MLLTFNYFPSAFKDVKVTDYISAISSVISLLVAFYAFYFAKDYLGQERRKNAAKIAIDIIQKDLPQLSQMDDVFDTLYTLEQTINRFHKSFTPEQEHECIKIFCDYKEKLPALIKAMNNKYDAFKANIFSASIIGCKIRSDNEIFNKLLRNYQLLLVCMLGVNESLSIALEYDYNESLGQFINPGKVEKKLKKLDDSIVQSMAYYKKFNDEFSSIQNEIIDLDDLFIFK